MPSLKSSPDRPMPRLVSVSRRTDVPAFHGEWFLRRLEEGVVGWLNPFSGIPYLVSLKRADVAGFVFWSKNFAPFTDVLDRVAELGHLFLGHFTITGLPRVLEPHVPDAGASVEIFRSLARRFPGRMNWRYDPIVLSDMTPPEWHRRRFAELAESLAGYADRCYLSFAQSYARVLRSLEETRKAGGPEIHWAGPEVKRPLAAELAAIAARHGITLFSCCDEDLAAVGVPRARCVDGSRFTGPGADPAYVPRPKGTRPSCGCDDSTDIGAYATCGHGCRYCYAGLPGRAGWRPTDPESFFLGVAPEESRRLLERVPGDKAGQGQIPLFPPERGSG